MRVARLRGPVRWLTVAAAGLLALGGALTSSADTAFSLPLIVRDASGSPAFDVQVQMGRADTGAFDFDTGTGFYRGIIPVRQTGSFIDILKGSVPATFYPQQGGSSATSVTLQGEINTATLQATIDLWVGTLHYHLVTANGQATDATNVAQQGMTALASADWPTLYSLLPSELQTSITQAAYVQALSSQQLPQIVSIAFDTQGVMQVVGGTSYFTQPIKGQAKKADGTIVNYTTKMYLILENGSWRVIGTDPVAIP
jgi:hypothetical protein